MNTVLTGTMCAAIKFAIPDFHAVTDDLAPAVRALGRHRMDRALKTVKCTTFAAFDNLKGLVVFISTDITLSHRASFLYKNRPSQDS